MQQERYSCILVRILVCISQESLESPKGSLQHSFSHIEWGNLLHFHECKNNPKASSRFFRDCWFYGVVGTIDGHHVRIMAPREHEVEYVNRKNYHSINVQIVCDASHRILHLVASWPGATHDARILQGNGLFQLFEQRMLPVRCHLLGDSGNSGKEWLLTPFFNPEAGPQSHYNRYEFNKIKTLIHILFIISMYL